MVMTRPAEETVATDGRGVAPQRMVARLPGLPGSRAVLGGLLIALAGVGTFVSWQQASGAPRQSYAVATRTLEPGDPVTADAVRFEPIDLPAGVAAAAFTTAAQLEGRVAVAPVGEGELVQQGGVSDQAQAEPAAEVSVALARDLAVDGRLATGDTVDVYATYDEGTQVVASGVRVISVTEGGSSFDDGSELTVTLALTDASQRIPVIDAAREGQVTLVRTTHVARATSSASPAPGPAASPTSPPPPSATGGPVTKSPAATGGRPPTTTVGR
jgi:Flp pilus assembly protein CpaB